MKLVLTALAMTALCSAFVLGAAPAPVQQGQPRFPAGPGGVILDRACGTCHDAGAIVTYHFATAGEYRDIVESMIGSGAQVSDAEKPVLVDYLYANFGKKPDAAAAADPGKAILETACTACHGLDGLANHVYETKAPYMSLVENMISYGASVTDDQKQPLVDYMFKTYGKKTEGSAAAVADAAPAAPAAPAADPGKAILETACTTCHGLDGLANHVYESTGPYLSLVENMISYGAAVTDAQKGPLVDYMLKTYGKK